MKIIETDNFGGDYPAEHFLGCLSDEDGNFVQRFNAEQAEAVVNVLNYLEGQNAPRYWRVVEDDYKLSPGFQP